MQINPYLSFNGKCEAAFRFYEKVLRGKILMMMKYADGPMAAQTPADSKDHIMHARLAVGDMLLMGSDAPPHFYEPSKGMVASLNVDSEQEAERIFKELSESGTVRMPIQETFWAKRFGMLTDQYGTPWMVNCEKPGQ